MTDIDAADIVAESLEYIRGGEEGDDALLKVFGRPDALDMTLREVLAEGVRARMRAHRELAGVHVGDWDPDNDSIVEDEEELADEGRSLLDALEEDE